MILTKEERRTIHAERNTLKNLTFYYHYTVFKRAPTPSEKEALARLAVLNQLLTNDRKCRQGRG